MLAMTIENAVESAPIPEAILHNYILILHAFEIPDSHSSDRNCFNLTE